MHRQIKNTLFIVMASVFLLVACEDQESLQPFDDSRFGRPTDTRWVVVSPSGSTTGHSHGSHVTHNHFEPGHCFWTKDRAVGRRIEFRRMNDGSCDRDRPGLSGLFAETTVRRVSLSSEDTKALLEMPNLSRTAVDSSRAWFCYTTNAVRMDHPDGSAWHYIYFMEVEVESEDLRRGIILVCPMVENEGVQQPNCRALEGLVEAMRDGQSMRLGMMHPGASHTHSDG